MNLWDEWARKQFPKSTSLRERLNQNEQRILRLEVQTQSMTLRAREALEFCPLNRPPLNSAPRPKSAKDCVQQSRHTARQKLRDHFRDTKQRPHSAFARIETKEATSKSANDRPASADDDIQSLTVTKLQQEVENRKRTEEHFRQSIELLKRRLQQQTEVELECRRRLISSETLVPVFQAAAEELQYSSAGDLVSHLQSLQSEKLGSMELLISAEEMNKDLRKKLTQTRKQCSEAMIALQSQHSTATRSLQEQCSRLKQELEASNSKIRQLEHRQEELTRLQSGIMELWSVVTTAPEFDQLGHELEIDDPGSMMCFLKDAFLHQSPVLVKKRLMEYQRIANRIWREHFAQDYGSKNQPLKVFEKACEMMRELKSKLKTITGSLKKAKDSEKQLTGTLKGKQREINTLKGSFDQSMTLHRLIKTRPQSAKASLKSERSTTTPIGISCSKSELNFTEEAVNSGSMTNTALKSDPKLKKRHRLTPKTIFQNH